MRIDDTLFDIVKDIQKQFKDKFDREFTIERIVEIFRSQFVDFVSYSEREETMKVDFLGSFTIKKGRKDAMLDHPNYNKYYDKMKKVIGTFEDGTDITEL
jgi:hypothetical protein